MLKGPASKVTQQRQEISRERSRKGVIEEVANMDCDSKWIYLSR
jgi:hypothetical protein